LQFLQSGFVDSDPLIQADGDVFQFVQSRVS
jgi:hypothetical protein